MLIKYFKIIKLKLFKLTKEALLLMLAVELAY